MLYKMYYKNNIELIHLFVTKTKCHISFLQIDILNKKNLKKFSGFSPSCPDREGTKFGTRQDTGRKPRPEPFSRRDTGQRCPDPMP